MLSNEKLKLIFTEKPYNFRKDTSEVFIHEQIEKIKEENSIEPDGVFYLNQIHSDKIRPIHSLVMGTPGEYGRVAGSGDGMITNVPNILLSIRIADCCPVLLYDPVKNVQAAIHSGWRGTLLQITKKAVEKMGDIYSSHPDNIQAFIGPSIGMEHFEVQEDVKKQWEETFDFAQEVLEKKDETHWNINLKETNRRILLLAGLKEQNITVSERDTYGDKNLHSYRRDQPDYGLNSMLSMILPS